ADLDGLAVARPDDLHRLGRVPDRLPERLLDLVGLDRALRADRRHLQLGAALEVDAEVEALEADRAEAHQHQQPQRDVPPGALADDVERPGPDVEAVEDALVAGAFGTWSRHLHASLAVVTAALRAARFWLPRRCTAPRPETDGLDRN